MLCDANSSHTARRESKACTSPAPALLWFHRRREEADGPTTPLGLRRGREAKGGGRAIGLLLPPVEPQQRRGGAGACL